MDDELSRMFVGKAMVFGKNADDAEFEGAIVCEVVDESDNEVEIMFSAGKRNIYLSLRKADFLRAIYGDKDDSDA